MAALKTNSVIGNYKVCGLLGSGAMGTVYRCKSVHDSDSLEYAIKVFTPDSNLSTSQLDEMSARFKLEGEVLKKIDHPNVVKVYEAGVEAAGDYIVMELLEGFNLKELLEMGTTFDQAAILDIIGQLLGALTVCHQKRIIHRDVKPANLVRINDGRIVLTDFGIVRQLGEGTLSVNKQIVGTPNYMSPEQIKGYSVDKQSDIWSAGVVLYELLTRQKPFEGNELTQTLYNITNIAPVGPRIYNPQISENLERIILKCLAKEPLARYQTTVELMVDLERFGAANQTSSEDFVSTGWVSNPLDASLQSDPDQYSVKRVAPTLDSYPISNYTVSTANQSITGVSVDSTPEDIDKIRVFCIECGTQNTEDATNCIKCKAPIVTRESLNKRIRVIQQVINSSSDNIVNASNMPAIDTRIIGVINLLLALYLSYLIYDFFRVGQ